MIVMLAYVPLAILHNPVVPPTPHLVCGWFSPQRRQLRTFSLLQYPFSDGQVSYFGDALPGQSEAHCRRYIAATATPTRHFIRNACLGGLHFATGLVERVLLISVWEIITSFSPFYYQRGC